MGLREGSGRPNLGSEKNRVEPADQIQVGAHWAGRSSVGVYQFATLVVEADKPVEESESVTVEIEPAGIVVEEDMPVALFAAV